MLDLAVLSKQWDSMISKVFSNLNYSMMKLILDIVFEDKPNTSAAVTHLKQWCIGIKHLYSAPHAGNSLVTQDPRGGRMLFLKNGFKGDILLLGEQMPIQQLDKGSLTQCIFTSALAPPHTCAGLSPHPWKI